MSHSTDPTSRIARQLPTLQGAATAVLFAGLTVILAVTGGTAISFGLRPEPTVPHAVVFVPAGLLAGALAGLCGLGSIAALANSRRHRR
jgi:hypothetical protein